MRVDINSRVVNQKTTFGVKLEREIVVVQMAGRRIGPIRLRAAEREEKSAAFDDGEPEIRIPDDGPIVGVDTRSTRISRRDSGGSAMIRSTAALKAVRQVWGCAAVDAGARSFRRPSATHNGRV